MYYKMKNAMLYACLVATTAFAANLQADYCCNDSVCNDNSCCDFDCNGAYISYENVIVRPHFTRNNAYFLENPNTVDGQRATQFKWGYHYSPRVELGWENACGLGVRGRYWGFNHDETMHAIDANADIAAWFAEDSSNDLGFSNSSEAKFRHDMVFHVGDIELTFDKCDWLFFIGSRIVSLEQSYEAHNISSTGSIAAKSAFDGAGLTAGFEYMHPLMCDFSVYVKGRGSLLYGDSNWKAYNSGAKISTSSCRDVVPVGELQLGLDWRKCLCRDKVGFLRVGVETQYWGGAGSAGPGCNAVFDEGNYQNTHPQDSSVGFFGFNIALGIIF